MPSVETFIRALSPDLIKNMLAAVKIDTAPVPNKKSQEAEWKRDTRKSISESSIGSRAALDRLTERISSLCDKAGETAVYSIGSSKGKLDSFPGQHARCAWLFLNDESAFRRAEEIKYADERRGGRQWDGFALEKGVGTY